MLRAPVTARYQGHRHRGQDLSVKKVIPPAKQCPAEKSGTCGAGRPRQPRGAAASVGRTSIPQEPAGTRRSPQEPAGTRRNPQEPAGARRNPQEPAAPGRRLGPMAEPREVPAGASDRICCVCLPDYRTPFAKGALYKIKNRICFFKLLQF